MQRFSRLFKTKHYTSGIDKLLMKLNSTQENDTIGKSVKVEYFKALIKKRDRR